MGFTVALLFLISSVRHCSTANSMLQTLPSCRAAFYSAAGIDPLQAAGSQERMQQEQGGTGGKVGEGRDQRVP